MLFQVYGQDALFQWLGLAVVLVSLILLNEFARRTKAGGLIMFGGCAVAMTIYCIVLAVAASSGEEWAVNNATVTEMNSWFHYAKVYAALAGCIGFMAIKYSWGKIGRARWFKCFPFVIVAINILIAVASDFESAIHGFSVGNAALMGGGMWHSSEGVDVIGGWWNIFNGLAGIINIFCMTGIFGIYISRKRQDMLWPDMTWVYIIAYDIWNFCYTYNCLPTHAWYCGIALLLAPTIAGLFWNKGGWIQNRAFTLAMWCMFAQTFPFLLNQGIFHVEATMNPVANLVVAIAAFVINIIVIIWIVVRAKKQHINPWTKEVWVGTKDFDEALARRAPLKNLLETLPKSASQDDVKNLEDEYKKYPLAS